MIHQFTHAERQSPLCKRLKESLDARLDKLRKNNDRSLSITETEYLRGQIQEIKTLLKDITEP